MALTRLDTEHFSDVEVAAREIANDVENLKTLIATSKSIAMQNWVGGGRDEFSNLCDAVERQMKDSSEEFWSVYDALVDAEGVFLTADQELATAISSNEITASSDSSSATSTTGAGGGGRTPESGAADGVVGAVGGLADSISEAFNSSVAGAATASASGGGRF